ncbi:MAG: sigma-70 family RNA polymerase sigma factor [Verrucomicrobiales bacterium]|nr:sigma-70 family RNA polymerase sigma factor [Verrucomicrobiales bacterium]
MPETPQAGRSKDPSTGNFELTRWSIVLQAKADSSQALNTLFETYRAPILRWLKAQGLGEADAQDTVQGFFVTLLQRRFLENVQREKGKFRTFLLTSLKNFLRDEYGRRSAKKRGAGQTPLSLDEPNADGTPFTVPDAAATAPDAEYDRNWAKAILDQAIRQLVDQATNPALVRALQPALFRDPDADSLAQIATKTGLTEANVKVAAHRLRKSLGRIIRELVLQTVTNAEELEDELRYLQSLFAKR